MLNEKLIDRLWLLLVALTLGGALLGEAAEPGNWVALAIVLTMAFKGRMVVDHFMGLSTANPTLRRLMRGYFYVVPLITLLTYVFGGWLARVTTL